MKKSKAVLDYDDDNFAIVFAAMGVRGLGPFASGEAGLAPWPLGPWNTLLLLLDKPSELGPVWWGWQERERKAWPCRSGQSRVKTALR